MKLIARLLLLIALVTALPSESHALFLRGGSQSAATIPHAMTLPSSPAFVYPMMRYSGWSGNLLKVKRASDSTSLDIGFNTSNYIDSATFQSFCLNTTCSVTTWYDESGNGNDATCTTNCPILRAANTVFGIQPITFMPSSGSLNSATPAFLTIPSTVSLSRQSFTVASAIAVGGGLYNSAGFFGLGTDTVTNGTVNNLNIVYDTSGNGGLIYWQENGQYRYDHVTPVRFGTAMVGQISTVVMREDATTSRLRVDGHEFTAPAQANVTMTGGFIGKTPWSSQATTGPMEGFAVVGYNSTLNATDTASIESEFNSDFNITTSFTTQVVLDGDSITCGLNSSGFLLNLPRQTLPLLNSRVAMSDLAVAGQTMAQRYTNRANVAAHYSSSYAANILQTFAGTNDIETTASGSIVGTANTVWTSYLLPYIQYQQTQGYTVVVGTLLPRGWTGSGTDISQKETERLALNSLITSNATTYGYSVADYASLYTSNPSAYITGGGSVDQIHPTAATYGNMAPILAAVLNPLLAANDNPSPNLFASNDNWPAVWQKTGTGW